MNGPVQRFEPRQPLFLVPWPVLVLIGLLCTAYAAYALAPADLQQKLIVHYALIPAEYAGGAYGVHLRGLWRMVPLFSYQFMHGGLEHLGINSVWLLPFGSVVARRYGASLFFIFFLVCGALGAVVHLIANWGSFAAVIGASGAISGLMGAAFRMMEPIMPMLQAPRDSHGLLPLSSRQIVLWSMLWIAINVFAGLTGMGTGPGVQMIAWQVHIGGYFAGLLLAGPFAALADLNGGRRSPNKDWPDRSRDPGRGPWR